MQERKQKVAPSRIQGPFSLSYLYNALSGNGTHTKHLPSWATSEKVIFQAFEWHVPADQRHWRRLKDVLPGLKAMGIDHIWIPPGCKGMDPLGNGYDVYDLFDLGEFDQKGSTATKWGTREDLQQLVLQAKALGIAVIWDSVLNHKAGADYPEKFLAVEVHPKDRTLDISGPLQIHGWVGFDFPGRGDAYSSMKYHWQHFTGVDWDDRCKQEAIYRILGPGKGWSQDVSAENGNYDYLMFADLDLSHSEVRKDLLHWGSWITDSLSLGGMRLDAAKHMSTDFQRAFVDNIRHTSNPDFFVIGEYWSGDTDAILAYLATLEYKVAAYDVPLLEKFSRISHRPAADLRDIFRNTLAQSCPKHAVTLVTNHDTQPGQMLETPVATSFKLAAYAIILLRQEGHPCVFYGDLYGICNGGRHPIEPSCDGKLPVLTKVRKQFAHGEQKDYFSRPNCIGFVRHGNGLGSPGLACVISNAGPDKVRMYVGRHHSHSKWINILQSGCPGVYIDQRGYGVFPVDTMTVGVWIESSAVARERLLEEFDVAIYRNSF